MRDVVRFWTRIKPHTRWCPPCRAGDSGTAVAQQHQGWGGGRAGWQQVATHPPQLLGHSLLSLQGPKLDGPPALLQAELTRRLLLGLPRLLRLPLLLCWGGRVCPACPRVCCSSIRRRRRCCPRRPQRHSPVPWPAARVAQLQDAASAAGAKEACTTGSQVGACEKPANSLQTGRLGEHWYGAPRMQARLAPATYCPLSSPVPLLLLRDATCCLHSTRRGAGRRHCRGSTATAAATAAFGAAPLARAGQRPLAASACMSGDQGWCREGRGVGAAAHSEISGAMVGRGSAGVRLGASGRLFSLHTRNVPWMHAPRKLRRLLGPGKEGTRWMAAGSHDRHTACPPGPSFNSSVQLVGLPRPGDRPQRASTHKHCCPHRSSAPAQHAGSNDPHCGPHGGQVRRRRGCMVAHCPVTWTGTSQWLTASPPALAPPAAGCTGRWPPSWPPRPA